MLPQLDVSSIDQLTAVAGVTVNICVPLVTRSTAAGDIAKVGVGLFPGGGGLLAGVGELFDEVPPPLCAEPPQAEIPPRTKLPISTARTKRAVMAISSSRRFRCGDLRHLL